MLWSHQQIDVGRHARPGLREVAIAGMHPLEHAHVDLSLGERDNHTLELTAQARHPAPAVLQVRGEQRRDVWLRSDLPGLAPIPYQRSYATCEGGDTERTRPPGRPAQ